MNSRTDREKSADYTFLEEYEREKAEQTKVMRQLEKIRKQEADEREARKPAFFRKDREKKLTLKEQQARDYQKVQAATEIDFDVSKKSHEELRKFFKVPEGKTMDHDMNEKMLESVQIRLKSRQLSFFAFLNKEFNIMNYKSARCSMHCFDNTSLPMFQVN